MTYPDIRDRDQIPKPRKPKPWWLEAICSTLQLIGLMWLIGLFWLGIWY